MIRGVQVVGCSDEDDSPEFVAMWFNGPNERERQKEAITSRNKVKQIWKRIKFVFQFPSVSFFYRYSIRELPNAFFNPYGRSSLTCEKKINKLDEKLVMIVRKNKYLRGKNIGLAIIATVKWKFRQFAISDTEMKSSFD